MKLHAKHLLKVMILPFFVFFACNGTDNSPWVMEIAGKKITKQELDGAYEAYLYSTAMQMNTTVEQLMELISHPEQVDNPQVRAGLANLTKSVFVDNYKRMIMWNLEAEKDGFADKNDVQAKINFSTKYFLYNLYIMEKMQNTSIEVSDEEAISQWEVMKQQNPAYAKVPIAEGMQAAKQYLQRTKLMRLQAEMDQQILEKYTVEYNDDFDISEYKKSAPASEKAPEKPEDKEETPETK